MVNSAEADNSREEKSIRLNKFLAERLGISRREADDLIFKGDFSVRKDPNSPFKTAKLGERIDKSSEVCYNGSMGAVFADKLQKTAENRFLVPSLAPYQYFGLNKPVGYVCSRKRQGDNPTIFELLPAHLRDLKTVGRLDKDSSGLILLTNDGDFAFQMTHPKFVKEKVYLVELDHDLVPLHQQEISDFGVEIGDGVSKLGLTRISEQEFSRAINQGVTNQRAGVQGTDSTRSEANLADNNRRFFRVTMSEGRNRQIRRTFAALGYEVVKLHRIQFGKYCLGDLKSGKFQAVPKVS